jgi:uncharacterized protein (TIGR00251 family)
MASWYRRDGDGTITLAIHAQPGAKRNGIAGLHGEALKVRIAAPALEDRANEALVRYLAEVFAVPRGAVSLASGERSREKRVVIRGSTVEPESLLESLRPPGR